MFLKMYFGFIIAELILPVELIFLSILGYECIHSAWYIVHLYIDLNNSF